MSNAFWTGIPIEPIISFQDRWRTIWLATRTTANEPSVSHYYVGGQHLEDRNGASIDRSHPWNGYFGILTSNKSGNLPHYTREYDMGVSIHDFVP